MCEDSGTELKADQLRVDKAAVTADLTTLNQLPSTGPVGQVASLCMIETAPGFHRRLQRNLKVLYPDVF